MTDNTVRKSQTGEPTTNRGHFGSAPVRDEADLALDGPCTGAPTTENAARAELTRQKSWSDPGNDDYDYPWPDEHTKSVATGELAERVRQAFGITDTAASVYIIETESYGGTEATQEHFKSIALECAGQTKEFDDGMSGPFAFNRMLEWLDDNAPKETP
jgi:hypothetical protein